jgi:DNA repair protein RAD50
MGVSKAILNNVIFCHQEDSNWPLDEGKKLKERFDAIFGTSEYNKAIAEFGKIRKGYEARLKDAISEKKFYEERKTEVERKERTIVDIQGKFASIKKGYEECEQKLVPLNAKKEQMMMKEKDYSKLVVEKKTYEAT